MKKIKNIARVCLVGALLTVTSSCTDYLDVSKEIAENLTTDQVFENPGYLKRWYSQIYATIPAYSDLLDNAASANVGSGFSNAWAVLAGGFTTGDQSTARMQGVSGYDIKSAGLSRWSLCYQIIRQAMIFLEKAPESLGGSNESNAISKAEMDRMKIEVKYLLAYNYFLLFEVYGPVPVMYEIADPEAASWDKTREPMDKFLTYVDGLLKDAIDSNALPETIKTGNSADYEHNNSDYKLNEILRPTKAAALVLRARLWVYAASPLFNGGYKEALQLTNPDGEKIFSEQNPEKWKTAKTHLEALLRFCESHGMGLYKAKPEADGHVDPNKSVYELFQYYNDEILWASGDSFYLGNYWEYDGGRGMEVCATPRDLFNNSTGNLGVYQDRIDRFFMANGLCIDDVNTDYKEAGFTDVVNPCNNNRHVDKHIFNMYANREPRFYANITYQGKSWHIQPVDRPDYGVYFCLNGGCDQKSDATQNPRTGYMFYKFCNRTLLNWGTYPTAWARPWILFRLADFYLYYAEVCNEITPSDPNIIKYLDLVRERAGIPGYQELAAQGLKNIIGDQEKQREAIRQERDIELMGEGNLYFDLHRWMTCGYTDDQPDNEDKLIPHYGMDMNSPAAEFGSNGLPTTFYDEIGEGYYYNRVVIDQYTWRKQMLLYPIPFDDVQNFEQLVQNPLW